MSLDLSKLAVIDGHCHFFDVEYEARDLAEIHSLSLNDPPAQDLKGTLAHLKMVKELASFLGTRAAEEEVLAERERRMAADYGQYVTDLFKDANIAGLVVDVGYQPAEVDYAAFEEISPAKVNYVYRVETVLDEAWERRLPFRQAEERFYQAVEEGLARPGMVGLKSIIAYRTGLEVREIKRSSLIKGAASEKDFRDYFFLRTMEKAIEKGCPLQVHSGLGESNITLSTSNPALLKGVLDDPAYSQARLVLLHGGYPYTFEAGFVANVYPNVYLDISAINIFCHSALRRALESIFVVCPLNKVMYGSDGIIVPEGYWLGARVARHELARLLEGYVAEGLLDVEAALAAAQEILSGTAKRFYGLSG